MNQEKETIKGLGSKSRGIRKENQGKVYLTLVNNSASFGELLNFTHLSRASLTGHLQNLEKEGKIEKVLRDGRVVYQIKFDIEKVFAELKLQIAEGFFQFLSENWPDLNEELLRILKVLAERIAEKKV